MYKSQGKSGNQTSGGNTCFIEEARNDSNTNDISLSLQKSGHKSRISNSSTENLAGVQGSLSDFKKSFVAAN